MWSRPSIALVSSLLPVAFAVDTIVDLGYQSYEGVSEDTGISSWLGMRYASPPLGDLRFAAPMDPEESDGEVAPADARGPVCMATDADPSDTMSEDCLFVNVWAPSDANSTSNLPVYFFIQGGGFNSNSNPDLDGTGLIQAADMGIVVVTLNYRVGLYGFLAGAEIESTNNGLKDQIKALEWVQNYISEFGGNPDHVTIGGASAGGASVTLLLTAYGGRDDGLFHAAAAESQSFPSMYTVEESQYQTDTLVERTECGSSDPAEILSCLRSLDVETLQEHGSASPLPGAENPPLFMYGPTIDDDIVQDITLRLFEDGKFIQVPTIHGSVANEGTVFAPKDAETLEDTDTFLHDHWPQLTTEQLDTIHPMYSDNETFPDSGALWRYTSDIYGDIRYACPGTYISSIYSAQNPSETWNYRYAVEDPTDMESGLGVPHVVEIHSIWGPDYSGGGAPASYTEENAAIIPIMQAYWTSFIRTYNPNTYRDPDSIEWGLWGEEGRIYIKTDDLRMEQLDDAQAEKCDYLGSIQFDLAQ
ncbi:hypothetical protein FQN54_003192 [Arachnomyces sp. PD_36]|nr:hypothetical protein FQN54_003192 [Arachnomyces sp. PD_36]